MCLMPTPSCASLSYMRGHNSSSSNKTASNRITTTLFVALVLLTALPACAAAQLTPTGRFASLSSRETFLLLNDLHARGDMVALEQTARLVIMENPNATTDTSVVTPFEFLGVAQYALGNLSQATATFEMAVRMNDNDVRSWIQLGKAYMYALELPKAAAALEVAVVRHDARHKLHALYKARNWMADWRDRDAMRDEVEQFLLDYGHRSDTGANALDFAEFAPTVVLALSAQAPASVLAARIAPLCCHSASGLALAAPPQLRVGFVSSDFGVHPVATLVRGLLALLGSSRHSTTVVYCFALTRDDAAWWRRNISQSVDHFVTLAGKNAADAAAVIRAHAIDVLIDLNGHTLHSGLSLFAHRPSAVQLAFLGYPMTTGSVAMDFVVSDAMTTPPETSASLFREQLLLLPTHYIVNDHLQLLGHTFGGARPSLQQLLKPSSLVSTGTTSDTLQMTKPATIVFATFSNWQKIDPQVFTAWMHILTRVPTSVLVFLKYGGHEAARVNLRHEAAARGVDGEARLLFADLAPWVNHTFVKRAADVVLDTTLKNGHTTLLDALAAGVPIVSLAGARMSNRVGRSALHAMQLADVLSVHSLKDYVELAVQLATTPRLLRRVRLRVERHRARFALFDTHRYALNFDAALHAVYAVVKSTRQSASGSQPTTSDTTYANTETRLPKLPKLPHIFAAAREQQLEPRDVHVRSVLDDPTNDDELVVKVRDAFAAKRSIRLYIGGSRNSSLTGWWIVNDDSDANAYADLPLRMDNLHAIPDSSVATIYAPHALVRCHVGVRDELQRTLREWLRVLQPDGELLVSVPDLRVLAQLYGNATTTADDRTALMHLMFGSQRTVRDVHHVGLDAPLLTTHLRTAGFCAVAVVDAFDVVQDVAATQLFKGTRVSLNVRARVCKAGR